MTAILVIIAKFGTASKSDVSEQRAVRQRSDYKRLTIQ